MARPPEPLSPSGEPSWFTKLVSPGDPLPTDKQIDILISFTGHKFSPYILDIFRKSIKKNWFTRQGKKSLVTLAHELDHVCAREYFQKLSKGDASHGIKSYDEIIAEKLLQANEEEDKEVFINAINTQISETSKLFTDGPFTVFKDNLIFDKNGKPIAVKEGNDRQRFGQCHDKLTQDNYERSAVRPGPDPEALSKTLSKKGGKKRRKTKKLRRKRNRNMH